MPNRKVDTSESTTLSWTELSQFCMEYGIFPQLIAHSELAALFHRANRSEVSDADTDSLSWDEFKHLLVLMAKHIFASLPSAKTGVIPYFP
jgi:hypothetical protein